MAEEIKKQSFLKRIKQGVEKAGGKLPLLPLKKTIPKIPKKFPVIKVGEAKASFPRNIPGRVSGETGIQTGLSVSQEKKTYPKLKVKDKSIVRTRNKAVQKAYTNLKNIQDEWNLYKKYKGSKTVIVPKPADGSLYKAEQALEKAKAVKVPKFKVK